MLPVQRDYRNSGEEKVLPVEDRDGEDSVICWVKFGQDLEMDLWFGKSLEAERAA